MAPRWLRVLKHVRYGGRVGLRHELRLPGPRPWRRQPYSYTYGNPSSGVSETTDACPVPAPPPAPQNLTGASGPGRGEASLNWDTVAEATGYKVEQRKRRTFAPFLHTWVDLGSEVTIIGSSAVVRNLSVNDAKRFRVKALNSDVESVPSNEVEVTLAPPRAPANVASSSVDHGEIQIMWDAVLDATGYVVEQHKNVFIGSDWRELPFDSFTVTTPLRSGNRFSAIVRGLTPGIPTSTGSRPWAYREHPIHRARWRLRCWTKGRPNRTNLHTGFS